MKFSFILQLSKHNRQHSSKMVATTEKKIAIRKAPSQKANTYDEGFIAMGNDNNKYIVSVDKKSIKRWMKMKNVVEVFFEAPQQPEIEIKPKRAYNKKVVKQYAEMGTQTDDIKKPRKPREARAQKN